MRIGVVGPGAVGGLLAGLLARAGEDVVCVGTESGVAGLRRDGLRVDSAGLGSFHVRPRAVAALDEPVDVLVVAVKAAALPPALDRVKSVPGLVVPLLNGVDHVPVLRARYPAGVVAPGVVWAEVTRTPTGTVRHLTPAVELDVAVPPGGERSVLAFGGVLTRAGAVVRTSTDEAAVLWDKLAFIAPLALLTARHGVDVGRLRERHRGELVQVIEEVGAVAGTQGAGMAPESVLAMFDRIRPQLRSSMQRDLDAGRPTELDAIGGAVRRAGGRAGLPIPHTARLVDEIREAEAGRVT